MSDAIGDLKILLSLDASSLQDGIKRSLNVVQGGVKSMNDQTVDWTGIFSRAVSPAVITGVASTIAFAIEQSMAFQQAIAQTGTAVGDTSSQMSTLGSSALNMSTSVPSSAADLANAMTQVGVVFGQNSSTTQALTQDMAELSASGMGPLNDIVSTATDLFRQYGVTTEAQGVQVLTDLMHAAQATGESIPSLGSSFSAFSSQLPEADKNISTVNNQLAAFSAAIVSNGPEVASQMFAALASAAQGAAPQMAAVGLSASAVNKSLQTDGGISSLNTASTILEKMGPEAALVATQMGLSAQQVEAFQQNSQYLSTVDANAKKIATDTESITQAYQGSNTAVRAFQILWNTAVKDVQGTTFTTLGTDFAATLTNMLGDAQGIFKGVTDTIGSAFSIFYGNSLQNAASGTFSGLLEVFQNVFINPAKQLGQGIADALGIKVNPNAPDYGASTNLNSTSASSATTGTAQLTQALTLLLQQANSATGSSGFAVTGSAPTKNNTTTFNNTFNIATAGSGTMTAAQIQKTMYNQSVGIQ